VPHRSDTVLSGATHSPCGNGSGPASSSEDPHASPSAPGQLPIVKLHEVLDDVADSYAWYTRLFPRVVWAKQPDPIAACQELRELANQLDCMIETAQAARRHVELLWELSYSESERRRQAS
jgi:hypothetical protein